MTSWFEDPKQLVRVDKVHEFWPSKTQSSAERVNATARFIIYATCIIYLIKRDPRIFVLGATVLGVLYIMEKSDMVKEGVARPTHVYNNQGKPCSMPTKDNPMGNVLMSDYIDRPDRPQSCHYPTVKAPVNNFLTDTDAYFLMTDVPNGFKMFVRSPIKTAMEGDFDTGNVRFKARERYSFGFSDPRCVFGNGKLPTS